MQKTLCIDNINYNLFTTVGNESVEENFFDSRTYNSGLDLFFGSDCITSYVYLVKKNNTPQFIAEINQFIQKSEAINITEKNHYLDNVDDFGFLHKVVEESQYDIFVSHFDMNMCQPESYDTLLDEHEAFVKRIEALSDFSIYAGAEYDDLSIFDFALSYLLQNHAEVVKEVYSDFIDDLEYLEEDDMCEDFPTIINTKDKGIILTFIKIYFSNIPKAIQDGNNFFGLINDCLKKI